MRTVYFSNYRLKIWTYFNNNCNNLHKTYLVILAVFAAQTKFIPCKCQTYFFSCKLSNAFREWFLKYFVSFL